MSLSQIHSRSSQSSRPLSQASEPTVEQIPNEPSVPSYDIPFSHSFFDSDPTTKRSRIIYFRVACLINFLVIAYIIWSVLPIYWGSTFKITEHLHNLDGWVVDLDGGPLGQAVTQAFLSTNGPSTSMTWSVPAPSTSLQQNSQFEHAVVDEQTWVIIAINPNASASLNNAVASATGPYNGSLAVTAWVNEARNSNAFRYIQQEVNSILNALDRNFAIQHLAQLSTSPNISTVVQNVPSAVTDPLDYTYFNTRPFNVPIVSVVNFVGLIYLTIISFVTVMSNYGNMDSTGMFRRLKLSHLIGLRLMYLVVVFFVVSAFYSLLSFAFGAPFTKWYGSAGFVIYWMMAWCTMMALGLALDAVAIILTPKFIPFFLILLIVVNVSCTFYPFQLLPGVYRYGYASPFFNLSRTVLTICFNTKNEIGLNFGVQISWITLSLCTITLFQSIVRRRDRKAWEKEQSAPEADVREKDLQTSAQSSAQTTEV